MAQPKVGGEAWALPSPALRNVFTRTRAAGACQHGQLTLLSPEPVCQAHLGTEGAMSPPWPGWLTAASNQLSAPALLPRWEVLHPAQAGQHAPRAAANCQLHKKMAPADGKVEAGCRVCIHMMSPQGERQKFPFLPYIIC